MDKVQAALAAVADARQGLLTERADLLRRIDEIDAALRVFAPIGKMPVAPVTYETRAGTVPDRVLSLVRSEGRMRLREITDGANITASYATTTVATLVKRGLLRRVAYGVYEAVAA